MEIIAPLGDLSRRPVEFRWQPVNGAAAYSVRLMKIDQTELWSTTVSNAAVSIPATVLERIVPGKTLIWQVNAQASSGAILAESRPRQFRVTL